ncbi:phospholipase D family protein [Pleurocapsales cyanobacterium LEGE 06147]|nr:phospholipase D family protein [Pleurocapsales cyanobacterium LEGE 06147]
MKLHIKMAGTFNRIPINSTVTKTEDVTLPQWMKSYQAVATQVRQRSPQLLRQKFGMSFLSESSIVRLLQQTHQTETIYQVPLLQWLQPLEASEAKPILYRYQFVSQNVQIELQPDDLQLPYHWGTKETSVAGIYKIIIDRDRYPGVSETWLNSLWQDVQQVWQNYSPCDLVQMAFESLNDTGFSFCLSDSPEVQASIDNSELSREIQEAIVYLREERTDFANLSTTVRELVQEYQKNRAPAPTYFQLPEGLKLEASVNKKHQFIIGRRKSRQEIESLINQAEQFLFISSYIIEDKSITELICQKAATLPQGVWVIINLREEVIDAIDTQIENTPNSREAYQHCNEKQAKCLMMLLDAGAHIRGGAFHLKTYISEQAAYLGSCNLTGGSLDFNLEGGLICQGSTTHQDLLEYFTRCWQHQTRYDVLCSSTIGNFIQRSLNNSSAASGFHSQTLLTPSQYRNDLQHELSKFSGKVAIYSRGFSPAEMLSLLPTRNTHVYCDGFIATNNYRINSRFVSGLHAKITLIGDLAGGEALRGAAASAKRDRIAYLGGINFQFASRGFNFIDLMYKTTNPREINQICQQLSASFF